MDKAYDPATHDTKWQKFWDARQLGRPESVSAHRTPSGQNFSMVMPPPNVTGVLHQGHALMLSLEDTLTRWHRMLGDETLYLPGTDHASIAVNMQVVKHLNAQGVNYRELGREKFVDEGWKWIREYQPRIYQQIRTLGTSCDWSRVRFTMDPELNRAVSTAFVELHKRGLIYRAERLVNWSTQQQTGLSDLEVIFEEREGSLWHLRYPVEGEANRFIIVATTRPETLLGDTGVAVHPNDERYQDLRGKFVTLPLTGRRIPIVADDFVDPAFGSGAVKITPAHDHTDFEVGERHNLPRINVLTKTGHIVKGLGGDAAQFEGLDRFAARKAIVARLEELGLLEKIEKHKNRVGLAERTGDVVEPYLSQQWYLRMDGMAGKAAASVESGEVTFTPPEFKNQFMRWMENIHDWCISRQLWWGQQIPAYRCEACQEFTVSVDAPTACAKCGGKKLEQDPDVLDTWFSSALWPFSTLGWPQAADAGGAKNDAVDLRKFYPNSVMETGFDILFFWVARMLMMGLEFTGRAPFAKVYLHPMVRDEHGHKMSKTKGNVIDPLDIIKEFGADTLRFTLNALCVQGRDLRLSDERIENYKHFINKIWNFAKFSLAAEVWGDTGPAPDWRKRPRPALLHDRWILSRLDATARDVNKAWSEFRMAEAAEKLYHFVWSDCCDWYLETVKTSRVQSRAVLLHVLGETLKLLHPVCPHATEELWHEMPGVKADECLALESFPTGEAFPDSDALAEFRFVQDFVGGLRNLRAESKVPPGKKFKVYIHGAGPVSELALTANKDVILSLARLEDLLLTAPDLRNVTRVVVTALEAGRNVEILIPLTELVDPAEEKIRLKKEVENLDKVVRAQRAKLANESFVSRAPPEVIDKERLKLEEAQDKLTKTQDALTTLNGA